MRMFHWRVRFRAQQRAKYCSLQLTANCIAAKGVSVTISNWFENHQPQRTQVVIVTNAPFRSKTRIEWPGWLQSQVFWRLSLTVAWFSWINHNRPLHDPVTWHGINYTGTQMTQWDFQNKGKSGWTGTSSFALEVSLRNLRPSVIYSVPCDRIVQRAYYILCCAYQPMRMIQNARITWAIIYEYITSEHKWFLDSLVFTSTQRYEKSMLLQKKKEKYRKKKTVRVNRMYIFSPYVRISLDRPQDCYSHNNCKFCRRMSSEKDELLYWRRLASVRVSF